MNKWLKVGIILGVLFLFFISTIIAIQYGTISLLYSHYVTSIYGLTGINKYLVKASVALVFIPFVWGLSLIFSLRRKRRYLGYIILTILFIGYNLSLYQVTKSPFFSFSKGEVLKWYALTPEGVRYFDGPGIEPTYGISLKPVTPDIVAKLKALEKGGFNPVKPSQGTVWFNPITGQPQIWYYKYPDGGFDFYDKPGYHPVTGEPLTPVTKQIYFEWRENIKSQENQAKELERQKAEDLKNQNEIAEQQKIEEKRKFEQEEAKRIQEIQDREAQEAQRKKEIEQAKIKEIEDKQKEAENRRRQQVLDGKRRNLEFQMGRLEREINNKEYRAINDYNREINNFEMMATRGFRSYRSYNYDIRVNAERRKQIKLKEVEELKDRLKKMREEYNNLDRTPL